MDHVFISPSFLLNGRKPEAAHSAQRSGPCQGAGAAQPSLTQSLLIYVRRLQGAVVVVLLRLLDFRPVPGHQRSRHRAVIVHAGGLIEGAEVAVVGLLRRFFDGLFKALRRAVSACTASYISRLTIPS